MHLFLFLKRNNIYNNGSSQIWIGYHFIKTIIAYLLLINCQMVAYFIENQIPKHYSENTEIIASFTGWKGDVYF
jgi:hypothetical protein